MTSRDELRARRPGGDIRGWVAGDGEPVVLLHGGPGLSYDYLDDVAADLGDGYRIAAYQQRGLAPSSPEGPFGIAEEVADFATVLDALGWERAWVVGHSWGAHLALRLVAAHPERLRGVLAVEPIGVVGDGGTAGFTAEMRARLPADVLDRFAELEALEETRPLTDAEEAEALELYWPSYFADPARVPPMPATEVSADVHNAVAPQMGEHLDEVVAALAEGATRVELLAGAASPIPWGTACRSVANLSPSIQLTVLAGAGHFPWLEIPGSVGAALSRLRT